MTQSARLSVGLSPVRDGELEMELVLAEASFALSATDALGDPLLGLANVAVALGRPNEVAASVRLYEGQFELVLRFHLQFEAAAGAGDVSVSVLDGQQRQLCAALCSREQIRAAIAEALALRRTPGRRFRRWDDQLRRCINPDPAAPALPWTTAPTDRGDLSYR